MELARHIADEAEYTYYLGKNGKRVYHGEFKDWRDGKQRKNRWEHCFYYHGKLHGEYKFWYHQDVLFYHCFYINGKEHPYVEMTDQEKLLFQIHHPGFRFIED